MARGSRKSSGGPDELVTVSRARLMDRRQLRSSVLRKLTTQKEEDRRRKSAVIRRKLSRLAVFRNAKTVACYVSLPYEVETRQLIQQMLEIGKRVVVPQVHQEELRLSEVRDPAQDLAPGSFGVLEPTPQALRPVLLNEVDLVVVPGVAFDRTGQRLGHGQGYFDRLLSRLPKPIPTVGLCFEFQLFDHLPTRPHDQAVQTVLSA